MDIIRLIVIKEPECSQCKCLPISAWVVVVTQCRVHCTPFDAKTKLRKSRKNKIVLAKWWNYLILIILCEEINNHYQTTELGNWGWWIIDAVYVRRASKTKSLKIKQLGNSLTWHVPIFYNGILRWRIINWTFRSQTVKSHHPKVSTGLHLVPQVDIFIECHLDGVSGVGRWIGRTCIDIKCKVEVTECLWNDISSSNR